MSTPNPTSATPNAKAIELILTPISDINVGDVIWAHLPVHPKDIKKGTKESNGSKSAQLIQGKIGHLAIVTEKDSDGLVVFMELSLGSAQTLQNMFGKRAANLQYFVPIDPAKQENKNQAAPIELPYKNDKPLWFNVRRAHLVKGEKFKVAPSKQYGKDVAEQVAFWYGLKRESPDKLVHWPDNPTPYPNTATEASSLNQAL